MISKIVSRGAAQRGNRSGEEQQRPPQFPAIYCKARLSCLRGFGQSGGRLLRGAVVRVEGRREQEDCCDAPRHLGDVPGFFDCEGSVQEFLLPITEPFLYDLVATKRVLPNAQRDVASFGRFVQPHVARLLAQDADSAFRYGAALARSHRAHRDLSPRRHGDAALPGVAPAYREFQVANIWLERALGSGDGSNGFQCLGLLGQDTLRIEERGDFPTERSGSDQHGLTGRQRYPWPILLQSALIFSPVRGRM